MTTQEAGDLCRITIVGPRMAFDVAIPAYVVLAELQSELLRLAGQELTGASSDGSGWILQRLGGQPLDEDLTSKALGLRDGDTVYLRPRDSQLPPADFDDIADGVATAVRERPDRWSPEHTATAVLAVAALLVAVGLGLLFAPGPSFVRAAVATLLAAVLGGASVIAVRIFSEQRTGVILGVGAVGAAALVGFLLVSAQPGPLGPALAAGAATAVGAVLLLAVPLGGIRRVAVGIASAALLGGLAALITTWFDLTSVGFAGVLSILAVTALGLMPRIAAWSARLRIPPLPASLEQLREHTDPEPGKQVVERAAEADRHVTGMSIGIAVAAGCALGVLGAADGWSPRVGALAGALALVLHARAYTGLWPRTSMIAAALGGVVSWVVDLVLGASGTTRVILALALVLSAVGVAALARFLAGRRLMPRWGWFGDLLQTLVTLSLLPLAGVEWGLYTWAFSLGG